MVPRIVWRLLDPALALLVGPAGLLLRSVRRWGLGNFPACRWLLLRLGVVPVVRHYYEPFTDEADLGALDAPRGLPGIDLNPASQLRLLESLSFSDELQGVPTRPTQEPRFYFGNGWFDGYDAEFLYNFVRLKKPRRIVEVGAGMSTLIMRMATERNARDDPAYACQHSCVEPYENPWLEATGVEVLRRRVEALATSFFQSLSTGDFLFIDSSHVIRPGGDVIFLYTTLLPALKPGVIVHVHDIFTPRHYPRAWLVEEVRFWDEQYLLEAFLTENPNWRIVAALNQLFHDHRQELEERLRYPFGEPSSFYIERV